MVEQLLRTVGLGVVHAQHSLLENTVKQVVDIIKQFLDIFLFHIQDVIARY